jgi:hypothetical protein
MPSPSKAPCGSCGGTKSLEQAIVNTCKFLVDGHVGVSLFYRQAAQLATTEEDKRVMMAESEKHDRLARETGQVVILEGDNHGSSKEGGVSANPKR